MNNINKDRLFNGYYLDEWGINDAHDACELCELSEDCDKLANDLNNIEYCMCISKGVIKDIKYKLEHPDAYFKKNEGEN